MKKTSYLLISLLLSAFLFSQTAFAAFTDVPQNHPYASDINYLQQRGIVQENTFSPEEPMTREVFAKWVLKNAGFINEDYQLKTKVRIPDVRPKENPYTPYIYKMIDLGAVELPVNKKAFFFHPNSPMKVSETLEWIFLVEGIPVPKIFNEDQFQATDVSKSAKVAPLIDKAINLGMVSPGKMRPYRKLKRSETAHFLKVVKNTAPTLTVTIVPTAESNLAQSQKYDILITTWNKILQNYLHRDQLNKDNLIYGAIEGLVKELSDKHSDFERPGDNAILDSLSGEVEGIGAVIQMKDDEVVVVAPIAGSPAEKAGLLANDIITSVDDLPVKDMKLNEVVAHIKGKKGTQVKLAIKRNETMLSFTITRDIVKIVSVLLKFTEDNIAVLSLQDFGAHANEEFEKAVKEIVAKNAKGVVLDLRNNPGGFLDASIQVAGYFVKNGDKVASVRYPDHEDTYNSSGEAQLAGYKIIVITNAGSASASEILAGALQDYNLAKIVGEKTFGKGTVQELSDFTDGSTLKLTVAEWLTPKGTSIEKNGVTPEIEVKITDEDRKAGKDPQMEKALEELRK